jgi:hypothetical protein
MFRNIKILDLVLFSFFLFVLIAVFLPGPGSNNIMGTLFTVASFLFGIIIAFSINNSIGRFNKIVEALKADEAHLLNLYRLSGCFDQKIKEKIKKLIDEYLIAQIDYYLIDYKYSNKKFFELADFITGIKPKNSHQEIVYEKMLDATSELALNRKQVEVNLSLSMVPFEWVCVLTLLAIILFCIFYSNNGQTVMVVTSVLMSTAAVILALILRDLDNLIWKESYWIWENLNQLFEEMNLLPYYPKGVLVSGRAKISRGQKVRVAIYPNPYPNFEGKIIKEFEV